MRKEEFCNRTAEDELTFSQRAQLLSNSKPVEQVDLFLSHTWLTAGRWKFICLLIRQGWHYVLLAWAVGTALGVALCISHVLPMPITFQFARFGFDGVVPMSFWGTLGGFLASIFTLVLFPCFPSRKPDVSFIDYLCISQTDEDLQQQGIQNIGGFLQAAAELQVLWSEPFLTRLWCLFELAAYRRLNPSGRISVVPIFLEVAVCQLVLLNYTFAFVGFAGANLALLFAGALLFPVVHVLRRTCVYKQKLLAALKNFDLESVTCAKESDKANIHAAIINWYGSLEAYVEHVRGPFRHDVQQHVLLPGRLPLQYVALFAAPILSFFLDQLASLIRFGAPWQTNLRYFFGLVVGTGLVWAPASAVVMLFACERWPHSTDGRLGCKSVLQTLAIGVMVWTLTAIGALA